MEFGGKCIAVVSQPRRFPLSRIERIPRGTAEKQILPLKCNLIGYTWHPRPYRPRFYQCGPEGGRKSALLKSTARVFQLEGSSATRARMPMRIPRQVSQPYCGEKVRWCLW